MSEATTYSVEYDEDTREYVANAGGQIYTSPAAPLAYGWLAQQILEDDSDA
jgi:hypothetical protein